MKRITLKELMKTISVKQLLITFVPSILVLLVMVVAYVFFQVSFSNMTRDVAAIGNIHPLSGFLSNLGILLWCAAASICGFTAYILRNVKPKNTFWFVLCSALLSAYLMFDDFFMFHDEIGLAPRYLGLSQEFVFAALGIATFAYLISFRRVILRTNFGVLLLALGFLSASVAIDAAMSLFWQTSQWSLFFENGAKWLGIASWCSYYVDTSYQFLVRTLGLPNNAIQSDASTSRR